MSEFDPAGYWEFHLGTGAMRTRGGQRVVAVPEDVLASLVAHAVHAGDAAALVRLGEHVGREARESLKDDPRGLSPEVVVAHASRVAVLFGLGTLGLVRWGDALVATLDHAPAVDASREALGALLSGLFSTLSGAKVACVPLRERDYAIVHPDAESAVRSLAKNGASVADVVGHLAEAS